MTVRLIALCCTLLGIGLRVEAAPIPIDPIQRTEPVSFERDILPILQRSCLACHSASQKDGELVLEAPRSILAGGQSGPAAVAGNGAESLILKVASHQIADKVMPPVGNDVAARNMTSQELGLLKLWIDQGATGTGGVDALSPQNWQPLPPGIHPVQAISLTDDGQLIAASRANQIFLYHGPTGALLTRLSDPTLKGFVPVSSGAVPTEVRGIAHRDLVQSLTFNGDGDLLASGSFREVKLWRRPRDVTRWSVALGGQGTTAAISPDRRWLAVATDKHEIRLLQTADGQPGPILTGHTEAITGLRFSRDGNVLYSGSLDLTVRQWDLLSGKGIARLDTPAAVQAIELVDTSLPTEQQPAPPQLLVTGHADSQLRVWNPISATSLLSPLSFVEKTAVSLDGRLLAVSDATGLIRILSLVEGPQLGREMASWRIERGVTALAFVPARPAGQPPTDEPLTDQLLVTGATDGTIRIWSPVSRSLLHEWRGDPVAVTSLAVDAVGPWLASGQTNGAITQWSLRPVMEPPAADSVIRDTNTPITLTALSPSRKLLAVCGTKDNLPAIFVRSLETRQLVGTLLGHTGSIRSLAFSADETQLVSGGEDKTLRTWSLQNPAKPDLGLIENLPAVVTAVAFSPDGGQILAGFADHALRLYAPPSATATTPVIREFAGHTGAIQAVGFVGGQPYSLCADKAIRFLNPADGAQVRAVTLPVATTAFAVSADGARMACAGEDRQVRIVQTDNGTILQTLPALAQTVNALSFSADAQRLAGLASGEISLWHLPTLKLQQAALHPRLSTVLFAASDQVLWTGDQQGQISQYPIRYMRNYEGHTQPITDLAYHPNGQTLFMTAADGTFKGYSTANGQATFATGHGAAVQDLAISSDGSLLATAGDNQQVRLWNSSGGAAGAQQLTGLSGPVTRVAFTADGTKLVASSAGEKPVTSLFETQTGLLLERFDPDGGAALGTVASPPVAGAAPLSASSYVVTAQGLYRWNASWIRSVPGHTSAVTALARIPTSPSQVLSGSQDGTVRRWNLDNAQAIQQFNHGGPVTSVAVDRQGERVVSASDNHTARLFRMDGQQIAEMRGDIRRRVAQTRAQQQLDAANARLALVKQLLQQAEQDLPVKTTAEQTLTASLAAANTDVTAKQAALEKAKADKTAAEAAAITASTNSKNAQAAKETAELAAKVAATAMQTAQATMQRLQQSAATDPKNEELKKLVATAMQDLATCQQKSDAATAAIAAPTQTAQQMATLANDAALKVNQMQKPFTDAAAALKVSQMNQNLLSQQQALAAKELKTATELVPLRKDSVTRAEAAQVAAQQVVTASGTSATEADLAIRSVAFSPDGQSILTAGDFVNAHLWDGRTGGGVGAFAGHTAKINSALFVDEGRFVTISGDQTVRCWEVNPDWKLERVIGSVEDPNQIIHRVTALDFTADSSHVLVAGGVPSRTGELAIFRVADGARTLHLPQAHTDAIYAASFSPDGTRIASGGADKYLRTFDVASAQQLRRFEGHTNYVLGVDWKGDGQTLVSAGADNVVKVWDAESADQKLTIENQFTRHVTAIQYVGETDSIVTSCGDKLVRMHNASNGGLERNFGEIKSWLHCVACTPDRTTVVAGDAQGGVLVWNGQTGQWIRTISPPQRAEKPPQ
jgi:WD40 repeat protein